MSNQHIRLAKEIQNRDFDALMGHTSIVSWNICFWLFTAAFPLMSAALAICSMSVVM